MKQRTNKGVHPFEGKTLSMDSPIQSAEAGAIMVYPLSQHIGTRAKAIVSVGERVLRGQMIAEADGIISAHIYSSVSGTVKSIEKRLLVNGTKDMCIIVENDNQNETVEGFGKERSLEDLSSKEVAEVISLAGIVGLGGVGFPTGVKLSPKNPQNIDTLIVNGSECEPYLTADYRLMLEKSDEIIAGIKAMLKVFEGAKAVIGIEDNKPAAIELLEKKTAEEERISVTRLKTNYPQGVERQLIYALTGRKINSKILPADAGCLGFNIATCFAIYEAVYQSKPLIHRVMTVTGEGAKKPCNLDVPLGMSFAQVLETAGGATEDAVKFIEGGPMMGTAISTLDVPIVKTSSALLIFSHDDVAVLPESTCIHCGRCVGVCPSDLVPQLLAKAVKAENFERFENIGGMECMECGCCTYSCPAKIPLTQMFKLGKVKAREMRSAG